MNNTLMPFVSKHDKSILVKFLEVTYIFTLQSCQEYNNFNTARERYISIGISMGKIKNTDNVANMYLH